MRGLLNKQKLQETFSFSFGKTVANKVKEKKKDIIKNMVFLGAIAALNIFLTIFLMKRYEGNVIIFGEHTSTLLLLLKIMSLIVTGKMIHNFVQIHSLTHYKSNLMTYWGIVAVSVLCFYVPSMYKPIPASGCFSSGSYYTVEIGESYKAKIEQEQELMKQKMYMNDAKDIPLHTIK